MDVQGKPFTALYVTGAETTKPYFHPVRAASGTIVTRRYPMEALEGELHNEKHQRGLWFSHGDVNGLDFWDNEASYTTTNRGFIVLDRVLGLSGGDKTGSIDVSFKWVDPKQKPLIEETRKMVFYSDSALRTIDFDIVLRAIGRRQNPLTIRRRGPSACGWRQVWKRPPATRLRFPNEPAGW